VLGSVLAIAGSQGRAWEGAALLAAYSAGLGVPFMAAGLAFGRAARAFAWVKRHFTALTAASAVSLAFFGVLLTLNRLIWVTSRLQDAARAVGLEKLVRLG
jgi:cytochrome c-type biogenesis protein